MARLYTYQGDEVDLLATSSIYQRILTLRTKMKRKKNSRKDVQQRSKQIYTIH